MHSMFEEISKDPLFDKDNKNVERTEFGLPIDRSFSRPASEGSIEEAVEIP